MKKYFTTGLAILLPIVLTIMFLSFCINFLTNPFLEPVQSIISHFQFFQHSILFFNKLTMLTLSSKILILLLLSAFIFLAGLLGKFFFIKFFFRLGDTFFQKVPVVNKIYKACSDVVGSLFSSSSKSFSKVVLVPYPNAKNLGIGFVTSDPIKLKQGIDETIDYISVFVPGTPNPSVGFLILFKMEQLINLNMSVDEAMKLVVSCGAVMPKNETLNHI